jgi:hypothetical protein
MSKPVILTFPSGAAPWNAEARGTAPRCLMKDLRFMMRNHIPERKGREPIGNACEKLDSPGQVFECDLDGRQNGLIGSREYFAFR